MLAMLFGCSLRRSELVGLELDEVQMRQAHWAVVDLIVHRMLEILFAAQIAQLFLTESAFVQKPPKHLRELRIPIVVLALDLFTTLGQVMFQTPQVRGFLRSDWPSALFRALPREAPASEQRRRLCGRQPFLTSTKSVRSGRDSCLESQTGRSCSDPPGRHSIPCRDAFSTGVEPFTVTHSTSLSCGCRSVLRSKRSIAPHLSCPGDGSKDPSLPYPGCGRPLIERGFDPFWNGDGPDVSALAGGLREDKLKSIRSFAKFLSEMAA